MASSSMHLHWAARGRGTSGAPAAPLLLLALLFAATLTVVPSACGGAPTPTSGTEPPAPGGRAPGDTSPADPAPEDPSPDDPVPDDPVPDDPLPGDPAAATPYEGPAFVLDVDADGGPRVRVEVPTGGYRLVADGIETVDGVQRLECTLEGPADDELVTQAFETLTLDWPGGFDRSRPAEVAVSRTVRGREYFVPPPHLVAVRHDADR